MSKENVIFMNVKCVKTKKEFYMRYDLAANDSDGEWIRTQGIKLEDMTTGESYLNQNSKINLANAKNGPLYKCPYCGNTFFFQVKKTGRLSCDDGYSEYCIDAWTDDVYLRSQCFGITDLTGGKGGKGQ